MTSTSASGVGRVFRSIVYLVGTCARSPSRVQPPEPAMVRESCEREPRRRTDIIVPAVYFDESIVDRFEAIPQVPAGQTRKIGRRLLVGGVVVPDGDALERAVQTRAEEVLADPLMWSFRGAPPGGGDRRQIFARDHFHYTIDSDRIRGAALEVMLAHEFRAHIFYSHLTDPTLPLVDVQKAMYFTLVRTLLQRYAGTHLELSFENEQGMDPYYGRIVQQALDSLDRTTVKKPRQARATVTARRVGKPNGGVSIVDYCLAIANQGLHEAYEDAERPVEAFRLETLAAVDAHIAHVADFDTARHRRRFDMLNSPSWARHISGANSHSRVNDRFVTSIGSDPTGHFTFVNSVSSLAAALGKTPEALAKARQLAQDPSAYKVHRIRIRGKWRDLAEPTDPALDGTLRRLVDFLRPLNAVLHPSCVAYVPGRSCVDAAAPHAGHEWIQKLDIKNFFPSTTRLVVSETFLWLGATSEVAELLSDLATFRNELTTGARTSPLISNLILTQFDRAIASEADQNNLTYTRYADDLVFSGATRFDMSDQVTKQLTPLGYRINRRKTVIRRRGQPIKIAGLTAFEPDTPRVPKRVKRRLRLELFLLSKAVEVGIETLAWVEADPEGDAQDRVAKIQGLFRYCRSIEPEWCQRLLARFPTVQALVGTSVPNSQRSRAVAGLLARIEVTQAPRLTGEFQPIGQIPLLDAV